MKSEELGKWVSLTEEKLVTEIPDNVESLGDVEFYRKLSLASVEYDLPPNQIVTEALRGWLVQQRQMVLLETR